MARASARRRVHAEPSRFLLYVSSSARFAVAVLTFVPSLLLAALLAPFQSLERVVLWPLETYEALAIVPVGFVRRHMPLLGGALVVLMTLQGIVLRLLLELARALFARVTFSRDAALNYRAFWRSVRDRYAFWGHRRRDGGDGDMGEIADWGVVHQIFGAPLQPGTSDDDLWLALRESVALCDDPALRVTRANGLVATGRPGFSITGGAMLAAALRVELAAMDIVRRRHLADGGREVANHFVYGVLNAETSPGWRIGYIAIRAMDGFVEFPLPRLDALVPLWPASASMATSSSSHDSSAAVQRVAVPEIFDLESMRWALEAILRSLGDVDGLILDVRFNRGGGSLQSALAVASFFAGSASGKRAIAFQTDEKLVGANPERFSRKRRHYVPRASARRCQYNGPLVLLQSQYTRGTAELLALALMQRANTCRIGAPSCGSLALTRRQRLPNCWTVDIPYMRCFSADGELYEGVGVPVDKAVDDMEDALLRARAAATTTATAVSSSADHDVTATKARDLFDPCIKKAIEHILSV